MTRILAAAALVAATASAALAEDGFAQIHRDNQKIGSEVTTFWQLYSIETGGIPADSAAFDKLRLSPEALRRMRELLSQRGFD